MARPTPGFGAIWSVTAPTGTGTGTGIVTVNLWDDADRTAYPAA